MKSGRALFQWSFQIANSGQFGTSILRATRSTSIANTAIHPGDEVMVRRLIAARCEGRSALPCASPRARRRLFPFAGFDGVQRLVAASTRTFGSGATIDFAETG